MQHKPTIVYLDHNATTPLHEQVLEAMLPFLQNQHGNPSSVHALGRQARAAIEEARRKVALSIGAHPAEIIFTGSGTEANNLALLGALPFKPETRNQVILSVVEHPSVLQVSSALVQRGYEVAFLEVDSVGRILLEQAKELVGPKTALVSVQLANNEVGTVQPVSELAQLVHIAGGWIHTDAVQALGKIPVRLQELGVDLMTLSAHKLYGPKGVGALWAKDSITLEPLLRGGAQEDRRRAGTENVSGIVGFAMACELFVRPEITPEQQHIRHLRDTLARKLKALSSNLQFHGDLENGLPNTLSVSLPNMDGDEALILLDLQGICASTGAACSSGSLRPSHVLMAMGLPEKEAKKVLRISLGQSTTLQQIEQVSNAFSALL